MTPERTELNKPQGSGIEIGFGLRIYVEKELSGLLWTIFQVFFRVFSKQLIPNCSANVVL